ncbi:ankyrin repeat-containing domain protein [Trichoderma ceciliae]
MPDVESQPGDSVNGNTTVAADNIRMADIMETFNHGDFASRDQSTMLSPIEIVEGYSREGLTLATVLDSTTAHSVTDGPPDIDIIHVMAVGTQEKRLSLQTLLLQSVTTRRREFAFRYDIASLLVGDLAIRSIDNLALQLLRGLIFFQQHDEQKSKRAIAFIAYGFGALVVKKAICIASASEEQWPGIFSRAARFVFSGCFQRTNSLQVLYSKVFDYLRSQRNSSWERSLTPVSVSSLASCAVEINEAFVASKITLRSQVISLYANTTAEGQIQGVFDCSTATIGLPNEVIIQEQAQEGEESFPDLGAKMCFNLNSWVPHESWISVEQTLLALSPAHRPLSSTHLVNSHPVFRSPEYERWSESAGLRILYLCGQDDSGVAEAAEQVFLHWKVERAEKNQGNSLILPFSFVFSTHDPIRHSIEDMLTSLLLSYIAGNITGTTEEEYNLMKDQLLLQHAWTGRDIFKLFIMLYSDFMGRNTLLLLQNIDECDEKSREAFWAMLSTFAVKTEVSIKIVITSRRSLDLVDELRRWPDIPVETCILSDENTDLSKIPRKEYLDGLVSSLCPAGHGEAEIRQKLEELASMETENLDKILKLIVSLTNWPQEPSAKALHEFCSHLQAVTLSSTPAKILGKALQGIADQDGLGWILNWLFSGQRPLSYDELAMVLCYRKHGENQTFHAPSSTDLRDSLSQLHIWLRGITKSCSGQVRIRDSVRDYFRDDSNYAWAEVISSPDAILIFLLNYLTAPEIQERLVSIHSLYESRVQMSGENMTPPLAPDGQDIIFYAIHALPRHLSENPSILKNIKDTLMATDGKFTPWSKAYWAMSNPFSRPKPGTLKSPYQTLLALGNLGPEAVAILKEVQYIVSPTAVYTRGMNGSTTPIEMDSLVHAIREGNEDLALSLAEELILASKSQGESDADTDTEALEGSSKIAWPPSFLWRATWLNMSRLVTLLLDDGMAPDPTENASKYFPSPLYMAARLSHPLIMDVLIEHGARLDAKRLGKYGTLYTAAASGNIRGVESLVAKDRSLLEMREPEMPLYIASLRGNWNMVRRLLELGADPNTGIGPRPNDVWAPLVIAAEYGHVETTRVLLEHKADPNICGPSNQDTPLWFAGVRETSVDLVRLLVENGADPNHELLYPPLLVEMVTSAICTKDKLAKFEPLIRNSPPVLVNAADAAGMTPLLHAAQAGELSIVTWLLEHGADVDATDKEGSSALVHAIKKSHVQVVRELLKWKPRLDILTTDGQTLLQMAMEDVSVVQMLLDAGVDVDLLNRQNLPAINIAVTNKKREVVKLLVDRKANLHRRDQYGWSPIMDAAGYKPDAEITRILAEGGANLGDYDSTESTPLHHATVRGETEVLKVLLEFRRGIDLEKRNTGGETPLLVASSNSNVECIRLLIRAGADVNAQNSVGVTELIRAAGGHISLEAADLLLSQPDIMIDMIGRTRGTALMGACRSLNYDMVAKLLAHGADPNVSFINYYSTALIATCMADDGAYNENVDKIDRIICELVAHGADLNVMKGCTIFNAICAASIAASVSTINLLIDKGASAMRPDPLGRYPIHFAAANGIKNFEAMALAHRGDLMVCDHAGKNVLHWAAQFGHVETVEAILERVGWSVMVRRQCINKADIDGWTPLCWATRPFTGGFKPNMASEPRAYTRTVKYLLEQGADRSVSFTMGTGEAVETFTPVQMARLCNAEDEMINLLSNGVNAGSKKSTGGKGYHKKKPFRKYKSGTAYCDICLNTIFGYSYQCQSCNDFDACKKCHGRIELYHGHVGADGSEPHRFAFREGRGDEFEDAPTPGSPLSRTSSRSRRSSTSPAGRQGQRANDDELQSIVNEVDDLGAGDLDDLDELVAFEEDAASP